MYKPKNSSSKHIYLIAECLIIIVLAIIAVKLFYYYNRFSLNGSISECTREGKAVYQFNYNSRNAPPLHYTKEGQFIPCPFVKDMPSESCKSVLQSLGSCELIYRTNRDWRSLPGIYKTGASEAIEILKTKIK